MTDGTHSLRVRARRGAAVDPIPATRTWTVDTKPRTPAPTPTPQPGGGFAVTQITIAPATAQPAPKKVVFGVSYTFRKGLHEAGRPRRAGRDEARRDRQASGQARHDDHARSPDGNRLAPGTTITVRAGTAKKVITIRRARAPRIG